MGHHCDAAGMMNQVNGIGSGHFEFCHPCGPVLLEETFECFVETSTKARFDERARNVRPPR
jgi:hypothetical protein